MKQSAFWDYFNLADEIYESLRKGVSQSKPTQGLEPLTLADMDERMVFAVARFAATHEFPWPPYLPFAEEYVLDHPELR